MVRKWVSSPAYDAAIKTLIAARNRQGLSQRAVEGRLGKTFHGFIAKIERKERQMNLVEFIAIARALGLPERDLFADVVQSLPDEVDI